MNPTKNLIELKFYMNPTKNLIELKLYMNHSKNLIEPKLHMNPSGNTISLRDTKIEIETKVRRMPTDPARIKLTDVGDPKKCPVF
jgi:tryptophanyl-tRNA synthetase